MKIVKVLWKDHCFWDVRNLTDTEIDGPTGELATATTVGFLLREFEDRIIVGKAIWEPRWEGEEEKYAFVDIIGKAMIVEMEVLEE